MMTTMKKIPALLFMLMVYAAHSQTGNNDNNAISILQKVNEQLNSTPAVSYRYTQDVRYFADNYEFHRSASVYMEYLANNPVGLKFQACEEDFQFVYDGAMTLRINKKDKTIDSASAKTAARMENNSYLYHSLAMLKNILPLVISNDTIQKSVKDTIINGRPLYSIKIERPKMYFQLFKGIAFVQVENLQRPYYLLVDKKTYLPYQFIAKYIRGTDDRDFVTFTYTEINTHPKAPAGSSWNYAAYAADYKPFKPVEKKPLVKAGTIVADFTLPNYTPAGTDSISLHQYAGRVVLLDFWFKSCGPCMEAMPHYNELQRKFDKEGFQLLTINIEDGLNDMKFFYNKHQPVYKMLFMGGKLFESLGLSGCPSSILLDKSGKVTKVFFGFNQAEIEKTIGETLAL
jgi:thiol-disulfide isomerase/thioredoxin